MSKLIKNLGPYGQEVDGVQGLTDEGKAKLEEWLNGFPDRDPLPVIFTFHSVPHLRAVKAYWYAREKGLTHDELVVEAQWGCLRAMMTFDPDRGNSFTTHAVWVMVSSLQSALSLKFERRDYRHGLRRAKETIFEGKLLSAFELPEFVDKAQGVDTAKECDHRDMVKKLEEIIFQTVKRRPAEMLLMYYGLRGYRRMTLSQIGKVFKLTRSRVQQIISKAIRQCSDRLERFFDRQGLRNAG